MKIKNPVVSFIIKIIAPYIIYIIALFLIEVAWGLDLSIRPYIIKIIIDTLTQCKMEESNSFFIFSPIVVFTLISVVQMAIFKFGDYLYAKITPCNCKRYNFEMLSVHARKTSSLF